MSSDLQRVAQGLIDALDQNPRAAADLTNAAAVCTDLANQIAELAVIMPEAAAAAEYLAEAARACGEAGQLVAGATATGRTWAVEAVGASGGATTHGEQLRRDAPAGNVLPAPDSRTQPESGTSDDTQVEFVIDLSDNSIDDVGTQPEPVRVELSTGNPEHLPALNTPPPSSSVLVDGKFTYDTDDLGRVVTASATVDLVDRGYPRDPTAQRNLIGKLPGDHAGHIFARIFQGPSGMMNLVPMQGTEVNLSQYKVLENHWRRIIEDGGSVDIFVQFTYSGDSRRPDVIGVQYRHPGGVEWVEIENNITPGGNP